jgi:ABC-type transport system substrate-binding protein
MRVRQRPLFCPTVRLLLVGLLLGGLSAAGWVVGQAPPPDKGKPAVGKDHRKRRPVKEEEDETPPTKVIRPEADAKTKPAAPPPADVAETDLREAARRAHHAEVKKMLDDLATPHDLIVFRALGGVGQPEREERVEPLPDYIGVEVRPVKGALKVVPLDTKGNPTDKPYSPTLTSIKMVRHYERLVLDAVRDFLGKHLERNKADDPSYLSRREQLLAAEQVLAAAVRFHESARLRDRRRGDAWDVLEAELRKELLETRIAQLTDLAEARDWDQAIALTRRLAATYTSAEDQAKVARPLADVLKKALNSPTFSEDQLRDVRQRLRQLEQQFPHSEIITPITDSLREQARALLEEARRLGKDKKTLARAQELLKMAEETWPQLPGLRAYRMELDEKHPVLHVGVRDLPVLLSPAKATTDTEIRALDLLFEGLVKACPDAEGVICYRPGLAEGRPRVVPLGREFRLPRNALWSNGQPLTSSDVRYSLSLLAQAQPTALPPAWTKVLDTNVILRDPYEVIVPLRQGFLDPLALMTFKVLPQKAPVPVDGEEFAKKPIGSGPFVYQQQRSEQARSYAAFEANANYGSRASKFGLPRIQEVRLYQTAEPVKELREGALDLVLDLTAQQAGELLNKNEGVDVLLPGQGYVNRRVYFLAINQAKVPLKNDDLRRCLARAINREELLNEHFRGPLRGKGVHQVLNGPFPAHSWACSPHVKGRSKGEGLDLFDAELSRALAQQPAVKKALGEAKLELKYPAGDPVLEKAMAALCKQVKAATGIELKPVARDVRALRSDVEEVNDYDLAYYHYDFPDETFWLWPLLRDGGNYLGFSNAEVETMLVDSMGRRDFAQVQRYAHQIHEILVREMPLIPLWQLDPLLAWGKHVKPGAIDPLLVFTDIDQWHLEPR